MARWPVARWEPVAQHGGTLQPIAVCLHHQAGLGDPAPVYAFRDVSAHFWLPYEGQPIQHVDTNIQAWHGVAHNAYSIGVETEGCQSPPNADRLNAYQIDMFAELMRWANTTHGIPLVLSESVTTPGLNYHRCQGGPPTGCPCDVRVNARAEILAKAGGKPTPPTPIPTPPPSTHPPYPGTLLVDFTAGHGTATWQAQMAHRGWAITVDDQYGPQSAQICRQFQAEKHLSVDGIVGPQTWEAAWTAPVT
jgi:N-acetyl-anhydromuramyl-L-alanine amidase AmpD